MLVAMMAALLSIDHGGSAAKLLSVMARQMAAAMMMLGLWVLVQMAATMVIVHRMLLAMMILVMTMRPISATVRLGQLGGWGRVARV